MCILCHGKIYASFIKKKAQGLFQNDEKYEKDLLQIAMGVDTCSKVFIYSCITFDLLNIGL